MDKHEQNDHVGLEGIEETKGGQTTNSPPANRIIQSELGYPLASGVDSMTLAVDFFWRNAAFFQQLDDMREQAIAQECPMPGVITAPGEAPWEFQVQQFGKEGYQWLITSPEYAIKLGKWIQPRSRPSAMIDIRCETLWIHGVVEAIDRILTLFKSVGAYASSVKLSRVDLCLDMLVQAPLWSPLLREHAVTRARNKCFRESGRDFSSIELGNNNFKVRMYDKDLEIRSVSKKTWMYDIWNLDEVPENFRVFRTEFQMRREALKELGINSVWDFTNHPRNLWAYCTQCWLKFTDDPEKDNRTQKVLPFWKTIQANFLGNQRATPLIRAKAVNVKRKQLAQQMLGQFTSLIAIGTENMAPCVRLEDHLALVSESAEMLGMDDYELSHRVRLKKGRYLKLKQKFDDAEAERRELGLPTVERKADSEGGAYANSNE